MSSAAGLEQEPGLSSAQSSVGDRGGVTATGDDFLGEEQSLEHASENEDEEVASNQLHTSRFWNVHTHTLPSRKS